MVDRNCLTMVDRNNVLLRKYFTAFHNVGNKFRSVLFLTFPHVLRIFVWPRVVLFISVCVLVRVPQLILGAQSRISGSVAAAVCVCVCRS